MIDYHNIKVWQKEHKFVLEVYEITAKFPSEEKYGLANQLRRASVSVPSNIAEGCGRGGRTELRQFMNVSLGSASEVEYQLFLAFELGYIGPNIYFSLNDKVVELKKMLAAYVKQIQ
jgi:four helix bundle protein